MQNISIVTSSNGLGRKNDNADNVSALMFYIVAPASWGAGATVKSYRNIAAVKADGIVEGSAIYGIVHYQASEFFRLSPGAELLLILTGNGFTLPNGLVQHPLLAGRVRQLAVLETDLAAAVPQWQSYASSAESNFKAPLSILIGYYPTAAGLPANMSTMNAPRVSVLCCGDGAGKGFALATALGRSYVPALGALLGAVAKAKVNESIAWVEVFNISDGTEYNVIRDSNGQNNAELTFTDLMHRCIVLRKYVGIAGTYFGDNHTCSAQAGNDFAYMNDVRTMDKAKRLLYAAYLPMLGSPLKVEPVTGTLDSVVLERFKVAGENALSEMFNNEEVSGFQIYVDPNQNVLQTGFMQVNIEIVPYGTARNIVLSVGYALKLTV